MKTKGKLEIEKLFQEYTELKQNKINKYYENYILMTRDFGYTDEYFKKMFSNPLNNTFHSYLQNIHRDELILKTNKYYPQYFE